MSAVHYEKLLRRRRRRRRRRREREGLPPSLEGGVDDYARRRGKPAQDMKQQYGSKRWKNGDDSDYRTNSTKSKSARPLRNCNNPVILELLHVTKLLQSNSGTERQECGKIRKFTSILYQ